MKHLILLSTLASLLLSACAPSAEAIQTAIAQTQTAGEMSDQFRGRLYKLLEEGSTLCAMINQTVTYPEFRLQLAQVKGAFSVALSSQTGSGPGKEIGPDNIDKLNHAFMGWDLAFSVWDARLNGGEAPHAPDAVRYPELVDYVGLDKLPFVGGVPGEGDVEQLPVITILMGMGCDYFGLAQDQLLEAMR